MTREQQAAFIEGANERREKSAAAFSKDHRVRSYMRKFDDEIRRRALDEMTEIAQKNDMGY